MSLSDFDRPFPCSACWLFVRDYRYTTSAPWEPDYAIRSAGARMMRESLISHIRIHNVEMDDFWRLETLASATRDAAGMTPLNQDPAHPEYSETHPFLWGDE